jgi:hypothetical protein
MRGTISPGDDCNRSVPAMTDSTSIGVCSPVPQPPLRMGSSHQRMGRTLDLLAKVRPLNA